MARAPQQFETTFDTYHVTGVIGEGGAGRILEVRDSNGTQLALKCLRPEVVTTEKRKRFKNEIHFCFTHQHPNLIKILDFGIVRWDNVSTPFYVMPKFPSTLRNLLSNKIAHDKILPLFGQILDGLEAAHLLGSFHRDLKPENVLYDSDQHALVVADFGIAHFEEDIIATAVETKVDSKLANLAYAAPEQRTKGARVDSRADMYALGLMLNEMFTGELAHGAGYQTIGAVAPTFTYLDQLVEKLIQQNPASRPSSIDEIKKELIGRKNEFIALQTLNQAKREVVPAATPGHVMPVNLVNADWSDGIVTLTFDRAPEDGWVERFWHPRQNINYIGGAGPTSYRFAGKTALIDVDGAHAQAVIDQFRIWSPMATQGYQDELIRAAQREEQKQREELKRKIAAAEERERVLRGLKI